jgi:uncharacterized membrane protein YeiH
MAEPAQVPLWIDLAAVAFGAGQGGAFAAAGRDERNDFDILGVAVFALVMGLGGGVIRDVLLDQVPAALRETSYLLVAVAAGFVGMLVVEHVGRFRWTLDALDALVVGLFVIVGALKTHDAGLPGGAIIVLGATTGIGGGVLRDLLARRPVLLVQRSTPYALVALLGAAAFVALDTVGAPRAAAAAACLVVVFAVRMLALARGWRSPAPFVGPRVSAARGRRRR